MTTPEDAANDHPEELYGVVNVDPRHPYDVHEVIARLVDGSRFDEFKQRYAHDARHRVRALSTASSSASSPTTACCSPSRRSKRRISSSSAICAASRSCSCRTSPASWSAGSTSAAGSRRTAPRWCTPSPTPSVPKFTVVIGGSFGAGNYGMCGRAYEPRFLWMWPNARISVMGGEQAAAVLATVKREQLAREGKTLSAEEEDAIRAPSSRNTSAKEPVLLDRTPVGRRHPRPGATRATRSALALVRGVQRAIPDAKFGVFRM